MGLGWRRKTAVKAGDREGAVNRSGLREVARDGQNCGAGASQGGRTRIGGGAIVAVAANVAAALPGNAAIRRHCHLEAHFARLDGGQARAQGQEDPKKKHQNPSWQPVSHGPQYGSGIATQQAGRQPH